MKRVFALFCIFGVLMTALAACGKTEPAPTEPATAAPTQAAAHGYEIQTTVDENDGILFQFSRPVFSGASPLVETANQVYDKMEAGFKDKMSAEANPTDEPWNYTELSALSYEADGVLSFTTQGDWWMGGVHNSWTTGHTFDFNLGRELKIADFLQGDEEEIRAALVRAFATEMEMGDVDVRYYDFPDAEEQSGPDANFYLAEDGVHVFYMPYVVPATQNGVDVFIPWASYLMKREYHPPEVTTQLVEGLTALEETAVVGARSETTAGAESTIAKIPRPRRSWWRISTGSRTR